MIPDSFISSRFLCCVARALTKMIPTGNVPYPISARLQTRPWGLLGGQAGGQGRLIVHRHDPTGTTPDDVLQPGDALSIITPGAGGYGDLKMRDREMVRRDLREGKISAQTTRQVYGLETE